MTIAQLMKFLRSRGSFGLVCTSVKLGEDCAASVSIQFNSVKNTGGKIVFIGKYELATIKLLKSEIKYIEKKVIVEESEDWTELAVIEIGLNNGTQWEISVCDRKPC